MKFCRSSVWLLALVFSAIASCAFADSSGADALDQPRLEVRGVDARKHLPGAHGLAFAHGDAAGRRPTTLALTVAWLTGCRAPDTGSQRASGFDSICARSPGANSSVTGAFAAASWPLRAARSATLPPTAPTTTTTARIALRQVTRILIMSPFPRRRVRSSDYPPRYALRGNSRLGAARRAHWCYPPRCAPSLPRGSNSRSGAARRAHDADPARPPRGRTRWMPRSLAPSPLDAATPGPGFGSSQAYSFAAGTASGMRPAAVPRDGPPPRGADNTWRAPVAPPVKAK